MRSASAAWMVVTTVGCAGGSDWDAFGGAGGGDVVSSSSMATTIASTVSTTSTVSSSASTGLVAATCDASSPLVVAEKIALDDHGGDYQNFAAARPANTDEGDEGLFVHGFAPDAQVLFRGERLAGSDVPYALFRFSPEVASAPLHAPQEPMPFDGGIYFSARHADGAPRRLYFLSGADGVGVASRPVTGLDESADLFSPYATRAADGTTSLYYAINGSPGRIRRARSLDVSEDVAFVGDFEVSILGVSGDDAVARPVLLPDESAIYFSLRTGGPGRIARAKKAGPNAFDGVELVDLSGVAGCSAFDPLWISPDGCTLWFQCFGTVPGPYVATFAPTR